MGNPIEIYGTLCCIFPLSLCGMFYLYDLLTELLVARIERKIRHKVLVNHLEQLESDDSEN